jgi:hypothetical protein
MAVFVVFYTVPNDEDDNRYSVIMRGVFHTKNRALYEARSIKHGTSHVIKRMINIADDYDERHCVCTLCEDRKLKFELIDEHYSDDKEEIDQEALQKSIEELGDIEELKMSVDTYMNNAQNNRKRHITILSARLMEYCSANSANGNTQENHNVKHVLDILKKLI